MRQSISLAQEVQQRARDAKSPYWFVLGSTAEAGYLGALLRTGGASRDEAAWIPVRTAEVMGTATRFNNPYLGASGEIYHALTIDRTDPERAIGLVTAALAKTQCLEISLLTTQAQNALATIHTRAGRPFTALAGLRDALVEHVRAGVITDVLADLAVCVRPLSAVTDAPTVDALIADIQRAHPATAEAYRLANFAHHIADIPGPPDILARATATIELIDQLLHRRSAAGG